MSYEVTERWVRRTCVALCLGLIVTGLTMASSILGIFGKEYYETGVGTTSKLSSSGVGWAIFSATWFTILALICFFFAEEFANGHKERRI